MEEVLFSDSDLEETLSDYNTLIVETIRLNLPKPIDQEMWKIVENRLKVS